MEIEGKTFTIRPAAEEDLDRILEIEVRAYPLPWKKEAFQEELSKGFSRFLVLTDDETDAVVAGYIVYWTLFEEIHVLNLAVNPEYRGLGVASLLLQKVIGEGARKEFKRVFLEVRKSNNAAIDLYKRCGFFIDHVKKSFYDDGEDAYFMVRYLVRS